MKHKQEDVSKALADYGPYRFFITITFQRLQTDASAKSTLAFIVRRVHKKLLGKRWKAHHKPLMGIVIVEYAHLIRKQSRDRGNCHFHILLKDHECLPSNDQTAIEAVQAAFLTASRSASLKQAKKPIGNNNVHSCLVTTDGILDYVTKGVREADWKMEDQLLFITDAGVG
jgi:hypothetical protein